MMKYIFFVLLSLCIVSCGTKNNAPDVSGIKVDLEVMRYEQDFFKMDSANLAAGLDSLQRKYQNFNRDFLYSIVGLPPFPDSVINILPLYINDYRSINDSVQKTLGNIDEEVKQIKYGLQLTKHYFPGYELPKKFITCVGPINSESAFTGIDYISVGLQMYLGKNFGLYNTEMMQREFPAFITRRFEKPYISVNAISSIIEDINTNTYQNNNIGKPLVEQMIAEGKKQYLLDKFMPDVADTLKIGYTTNQLQGCYDNEESIWSYFVNNDLLFSTDPMLINEYMNEGPSTQALGAASPGFIGKFVGLQIVRKWMDADSKRTLDILMKTPPSQIFQEAKYKP